MSDGREQNVILGAGPLGTALAGRSVSVLGDIEAPHTYAFVDDVARGLIKLANNDDALGQVWHLPAARTLTHRELVTHIFEEADLPPKIRGSRLSGYFVRAIGLFQPDVAEVAEMLYQFDQSLVVVHDKFAHTFGAKPTPHRKAIQQTLEWYKENPYSKS